MYQETFTFNNVDVCDSLIAFLKYNCDHITIKRNDFCYYIILHGCEDGHVCFNNEICTFEELNDLFREEQDLSSTNNICVNVFCCFWATQQEYNDEHTQITSMYKNNSILKMMINSEEYMINLNFSYHNQ